MAEVLSHADPVFGQIDGPWGMAPYEGTGFLLADFNNAQVKLARDVNVDGNLDRCTRAGSGGDSGCRSRYDRVSEAAANCLARSKTHQRVRRVKKRPYLAWDSHSASHDSYGGSRRLFTHLNQGSLDDPAKEGNWNS